MCKAYSYLVDDGAENKKPKNSDDEEQIIFYNGIKEQNIKHGRMPEENFFLKKYVGFLFNGREKGLNAKVIRQYIPI